MNSPTTSALLAHPWHVHTATAVTHRQHPPHSTGRRMRSHSQLETSEGGASRMLMCTGTRAKGGETGRVFGEHGWMDGLTYRGTMKDLPDLSRPPLPPGVKAGGHGGSHGPLMNEFVLSILEITTKKGAS